MPELTPLDDNRQEHFLNGEDLEPITRREHFYAGRESELPAGHQEPETREEWFIQKYRGGGGDITVEEITITENGTTTAPSGKAYSPIHTNVPQPTLSTLEVSENGDYDAPNGTAYNRVEVTVPLPQNAYLKKTATTSMSDAEQLPVASAVVSVTDKDKAELFLTSDGVVSEDNSPYLYRQSPSGKSCVDLSVVGGTVAWNQLQPVEATVRTITQNNVTITDNRDGSYTVSTTSEGASADTLCANTAKVRIYPNHVYLKTGAIIEKGITIYDGWVAWGLTSANARLFKRTSSTTSDTQSQIKVLEGSIITTPVKVYPQVFDLTQMFGSTIADYIYSLEQATAGAGISYFRNLFPKSYYAYNAGTLMSVNASSHDTTGKNQFDIDSPHEAVSGSATYTYTVRVKPNTAYTMSSNVPQDNPASLYFNGEATNVNGVWNGTPRTFTSDANGNFVVYVRYNTTQGGIDLYTAVKNGTYWIQLEEGSTATAYEPYIKHTYPLDSDLTLRGIPKLDANNNLYYDGDVYSADGSVKRKYGVVDLSTFEWTANGTNSVVADITGKSNDGVGICNKLLQVATGTSIGSMPDNSFKYYPSNNRIAVKVDGILPSNASTLLSGIYLVYELATPTTESAQPYTNPQLVGSTEEFVDAGTSASTPTRDVDIPVGQDSKYVNGNIYIKYLDSVTTGDIELADENAIIPLENTTYISSNGSASIDYWSKEV